MVVPERDLVMRAKLGDRDAFRELASRYYGKVYRMIYAMVGHEDSALDLTQETFARALVALPDFEMTSSFYTWLFRIARNLVVDHIRSKAKFVDFGPEELASQDGGPQQSVEAREEGALVWAALASLKPAHREVLILREVEEMSYSEIAHVLGIHIGTVMSRLFHARKAFARAFFEKKGGKDGLRMDSRLEEG